jgi:hypothetical protein
LRGNRGGADNLFIAQKGITAKAGKASKTPLRYH